MKSEASIVEAVIKFVVKKITNLVLVGIDPVNSRHIQY